ncbi:hypothetical protein NDU88_003473 [Pleurodeles waltl]|uniref:Secreted protein n=1 Tax=Pleurodeles waltl TaxID=8319 RepID=A0AAV7T582_PLEWA|nr:hypothetical protein NDU88_003473 [Pleurodeles waltl]
MHREALLVSRSPPTLFLFRLLLVESPGVSGKIPRREQREGALSASTPRKKKEKTNRHQQLFPAREATHPGAGLEALHNPSLSPSLSPGVSPPNLFLVTTRGPLYGRGDPLARRSNCGTAPALSASFPGQGSQVASLVRWEFAVGASTGRHVPPLPSKAHLYRAELEYRLQCGCGVTSGILLSDNAVANKVVFMAQRCLPFRFRAAS